MPSSNRPPDSRSRLALALASICGGRSGRLATSVMNRIRLVTPMSVPMRAKVSRKSGTYG
jgi:hypothetical protein